MRDKIRYDLEWCRVVLIDRGIEYVNEMNHIIRLFDEKPLPESALREINVIVSTMKGPIVRDEHAVIDDSFSRLEKLMG